jgi:hypothetical protein
MDSRKKPEDAFELEVTSDYVSTMYVHQGR